ncbi:MAG TPA: CorA family divalent cation transporter, partial [Stenotrophomonas sp.]
MDARVDAPSPSVHITLYGADSPRRLQVDELPDTKPGSDELLWVDLTAPSDEVVSQVWQALELDEQFKPVDPEPTYPGLWKLRTHFVARVVSVGVGEDLEFQGTVLTLVAGQDFVVTYHAREIAFLSELKARQDDALTDIGCLGEASFVAILLDWHLSTYFAAGAAFEIEIERLEVAILSDVSPGRLALPRLRLLRKSASRLRRMLAPHRVVFDGLSRPDFAPEDRAEVTRHLHALDTRFERAMDIVENARELVVGSFQLFSTQTELQTNERMKLLTFVTVVLGLLAVIAGVLGMNFNASFFESKTLGFFVAVGGMLALGSVATVIG